MRRGRLAHYGALCRKHQAPLRSRPSDLRRQISYVVTPKEPLISIPVCLTESTVAASTPLYELGGRLSLKSDKTDKSIYLMDFWYSVLIQAYVSFKPSLREMLGSQPSSARIFELSEFRPRTPFGASRS